MNLHIDNDTCHEIIFTQGGVSHSLDKLYYNEHLVWQKQSQHDYSQDYFTIESLEDNNDITFVANGTPPSLTLYYSTNNGTTWTSNANAASKQWVLNTGDKLLLKANTSQYYTDYINYWSLRGSKTHNVYGNMMSLLYGDNFPGQTILASSLTFCAFFENDTHLVDASNLVLPATTLTNYCYQNMFNLCTSLTGVPSLPATTLVEGCYNGMFFGCTTLTTAPELHATTLVDYCYHQMFQGCSSLKKVVCLATNISATFCTESWLYNVYAIGDFYKAASMSSWPTGTSGIPSGWTVNNYTS